MTERLRELLAEAAADAPRVTPADNTWRRARRARVRDVVVVPIAIIVVLVLTGLSMAHVTATSRGGFEPVEGNDPAPALPDKLYAVPRWVEPTQDGLDVGQLSIAWTQKGLPGVVGVSATTGEYVVLDLPDLERRRGFMDNATSRPALSPDGRQLAYAWLDVEGDDPSTHDAGIAVVDLVSGAVDRHQLELPEGGADEVGGISPIDLRWSADGRQLSFRLDAIYLHQRSEGLRMSRAVAGPWEVMDAETGEVVTWSDRKVWYDDVVTPALDGQSLLVARDGAIWRVTSDGPLQKIATWRRFGRAGDILWTSQGIAVSDPERLRIVERGDGHAIGLPSVTVYGRRALLAASYQMVASIGPLHRAVLDLSPLSPDSELSSRQLYLFGDHPTPQLQGISVAAAALDAEPRESSPPDWGLSPRGEKLVWLAGGCVTLAIAVLVGGFVWWRRVRVRP